MVTRRSPGGSIMPYPYKGGEIYGVHFGSFHDDEAGLLDLMRAEEEFMARSHREFPFWIDFYETRLTDRVLVELARSLERLGSRIVKLAVVGCSARDQRRLRRLAKKAGVEIRPPLRFFSDPEVAKTWLVSESS